MNIIFLRRYVGVRWWLRAPVVFVQHYKAARRCGVGVRASLRIAWDFVRSAPRWARYWARVGR